MQQNFIEQVRGSVTTFTSDNPVRCELGDRVAAGDDILRVITRQEPGKKTLFYYGCRKQLSYREMFIGDQKSDFFRYDLTGPDNKNIISLIKQKSPGVVTSLIMLNDQKVYQIQAFQRAGYKEIFYSKFPFVFAIKFNGFDIQEEVRETYSGQMRLRVYPNKRVEYFNHSGEFISRGKFLEKTSFNGLDFVVGTVLKDLPATKFLNAGNRNQKLIQELLSAQSFLSSNTNIEYVRDLINRYIKNAQDGELIDNRK